MEQLTIEKYHSLIDKNGLEEVWKKNCELLKNLTPEVFSEKYFDYNELGWLYENGLAYTNKISKKEMGKYYTPNDVSNLMAQFLFENDDNKVLADTGCGTGNLILAALEYSDVIEEIHLYDLDEVAINICEAKIICKYKNKYKIVKHIGNFLNKEVKVPNNAKVIANPPYFKYSPNEEQAKELPALKQAKDLYVGFIEKIIQSTSDAVIITPQSYLVGDKFSVLREELLNFSGDIYSFDNVPGSVFNGKKEGVFNTNTSNSVRASILHIKDRNGKGFRLTHLIRFKQEEREKVINYNYLKQQLGNHYQDLKQPLKCFKELENFVYQTIENSTLKIEDLISRAPTEYKIRINNSARYFTVGTKIELKRDGYFDIYANSEENFYKLYLLINSSYVYMFYRMYDGGILFPKSILLKIPVLSINLSEKDVSEIKKVIESEKDFLVYKKNAGKNQESVKFSNEIRKKLNSIINLPNEIEVVHKNSETL